MAAPDVDARYFEKVANLYPTVSQRTTLYVCARDVALLESGDIHLDRRVGYTPPITVIAGIDTVDATNVNLDRLGHGYFADAYNVVYDLWFLLHFNLSPKQRLHIVEIPNRRWSNLLVAHCCDLRRFAVFRGHSDPVILTWDY